MKHVASWKLKSCVGIAAFVLAVLFFAIGLVAQSPILEFSFDRTSLAIPLEGSATAWLHVSNTSIYEADAIEVTWLSGPVDLEPGSPLDVLNPFSDAQLAVTLFPSAEAAEGQAEATFEISYTYCIDDLCFQIFEELMLDVDFIPAIMGPDVDPIVEPILIAPGQNDAGFKVAVLLILGLGLGLSLVAGKMWGRRWWIMALLVAIIVTGLAYGIVLKQDQQAQSIGAVLCTSCVGIEETPHEDPILSDEARERIAALTNDVELLLFTATWCHACPFAKAIVEQVVDANPLVTVRLIDVDEAQGAASDYGIIQSGRTIVPAILRVNTGEVIFGIEDLERRLLSLLEVSP